MRPLPDIELDLARQHKLHAQFKAVSQTLPGRCLVVFFAHYEAGDRQRTLQSTTRFFQSLNCDVWLISSSHNSWFQYPQMREMITTIGHWARFEYAEIISYGLSMGGYAAIKWAELLGARQVLAVSPQYSVDPRKVSFETRWSDDVAQIEFVDDEISLSPNIDYHFIVDRDDALDWQHFQRFAEIRALKPYLISFGGHFAAHILIESGLSRLVFEDLLGGQLNPAGFRRRFRQQRTQSITYLSRLYQRLCRRQQQGLTKQAADFQPLLEQIAALEATHPRACLEQSQAWRRLGQIDKAIEIMRLAVDMEPQHPRFQFELGQLLLQSLKPRQALSALQQAVHLAPNNARFEAALKQCQSALGPAKTAKPAPR